MLSLTADSVPLPENDQPGDQLWLPMPAACAGLELAEPIEAQRKRYSLKIVEGNQARLAAILAMLGAGVPKREIMRQHQIGWHTLQRIEELHGAKLATLKTACARRLLGFSTMAIEFLTEQLVKGNLDADKIAVAIGIAIDKANLLNGEATMIVAQEEPRRFTMERLNERLGRRAGPIIDVTPGTGSVAEKAQQQAPTDPAPALESSPPFALNT